MSISRSSRSKLVAGALTSALALAAPFIVLAAFEEVAIPKPDVIVLTIKAVKSGTLQEVGKVVPKNTEIGINWQSDAKNGCYSDFKPGKLEATGTVTGQVTKTRAFTVTCYGNGASRTARVQVAAGAQKFNVTPGAVKGLVAAYDSKGKKIASTYLATAPANLQGVVQNAGNLDSSGIDAQFEFNDGTSWVEPGGSVKITSLAAGTTRTITRAQPVVAGKEYQFKFCVQFGAEEKCAPIPGKYKFIAQ